MTMQGLMPGNHDATGCADRPSWRPLQAERHEDFTLPKVGSNREASRGLIVLPVDHFGHLYAAGVQAVAGLAKSLASVAGFPYSWNAKHTWCPACTLIQVFFCTYSNELICRECRGVREAPGAMYGLVALTAFLFGGIPHV